jgi:hypothetical protein
VEEEIEDSIKEKVEIFEAINIREIQRMRLEKLKKV